MKKECFSWKARVTGVIQIMSFTVGAVLFFYALRNIYLIDLAIVSCCTIGAGVKKYIWDNEKIRRGNVIAAGVLYMAVWMMALFLMLKGFVGKADLPDVSEEWLDLLLAGEVAQIGKNTSFGFGKYHLEYQG